MGQSLCNEVHFLVIFMNSLSRCWVSWSGKKALLTLAKYSEDFLAFWNYKLMYLYNINWSTAQCSPFSGPDYVRSVTPTAVQSVFTYVMFCLINKSSTKFRFEQLWFHSQWQFLFGSFLATVWSKSYLIQVISTTQYYSIFFFLLFLCIMHLFTYFRNICITT